MVLTTLFECGRESRFDGGEANENGPKACTIRLSKMSKNYERKFWVAESRRTSGLVGKIVNWIVFPVFVNIFAFSIFFVFV